MGHHDSLLSDDIFIQVNFPLPFFSVHLLYFVESISTRTCSFLSAYKTSKCPYITAALGQRWRQATVSVCIPHFGKGRRQSRLWWTKREAWTSERGASCLQQGPCKWTARAKDTTSVRFYHSGSCRNFSTFLNVLIIGWRLESAHIQVLTVLTVLAFAGSHMKQLTSTIPFRVYDWNSSRMKASRRAGP